MRLENPHSSLPFPSDEGVPIDLELDLLVDGELPEAQRKALLQRLDAERSERTWRDLALRFLAQQSERQTVRGLMAGGKLLPVEFAVPQRRRILGRIAPRHIAAAAAGLLIATTSALVTLYVLQTATPQAVIARDYDARLPAEVAGIAEDISVPVKVYPNVPPKDALGKSPPDPASRYQAWIIEPDGKGRAVIIPVNATQSPVY